MGPARARSARRSSARSRSGITGSAGGHELSQRLAKVETAIFRNKTITFEYFTMERDDVGARKVDPYHLLFQGGQFYLLGHSHERERAARLPAVADPGQGRLRDEGRARLPAPHATSTRAPYANRAEWQFGDAGRHRRDPGVRAASPGRSSATSAVSARSARPTTAAVVFATSTRTCAMLVAWVLRLGEHARVEGPPELVAEVDERLARLAERHDGRLELAAAVPPPAADAESRSPATATAAAARPRSAPSASPASSRSPRSSSTPGRAGSACAAEDCASACRSPTRSCARTSTS